MHFAFYLQAYLFHGIILCLAPVQGQEDVDVLVYMRYGEGVWVLRKCFMLILPSFPLRKYIGHEQFCCRGGWRLACGVLSRC